MITEKEKQNREELFRLMQEHPDLPVLPMVDEEIVADDCSVWWMGSWGPAEVNKYITTEDRVHFETADPDEVMPEVKGWDWYDNATEEEVEAEFKALPWIEAIIVFISTPEI